VVETVRAAGLMVVASAGNNGGAGCASVIDPIAIYDATFSVGAHDAGGNLAGFSSRGPVSVDGSGRLKPDLTAPGVGVLSTYRFDGTTSLSGTSMASQHVAGAVALLWSAAPWLVGNVDMTEQVLLRSATPVTSTLCGGNSENNDEPISPNNAFGYGMLDVAAAVEMAMQPWQVSVAVTNGVGAPVVGATVTWIDARTNFTATATTDMMGAATISPTLAGNYRLQVRDDAGIVEIDGIELATESDSPRREIAVLYDATQVPFPSRHYLPGIRLH
jgi:subtilisin family serine protease